VKILARLGVKKTGLFVARRTFLTQSRPKDEIYGDFRGFLAQNRLNPGDFCCFLFVFVKTHGNVS
jgi:hypothetical protein